jgi:hypothetical protein
MIKKESSLISDYLKVGVIFLSMVMPICCIAISGEILKSLSAYWNTPAQPIFIITNAAVSYFLFSIKEWRISSFLLLLITAFSINFFENVHNILAVLFFLLNLYPLYKNKRSRKYIIPYISFSFLLFFGLLWYEIAAIYTLGVHHLEMMVLKIRMKKIRS